LDYGSGIPLGKTLELEAVTADVEASEMDKTDREILMEIHSFMSNINEMLVHVAPALDGLAKSPMGKMLGIK
jgi:hypothetical protein